MNYDEHFDLMHTKHAPYMPVELFEIVYSEAYKEGHVYGFSEVDACLYGIVEFVEKIQRAIKE